MKERIRELALQAGVEHNPDREGLELFAELIIQECCDMVSKRPYVDDGVSIYLHPSTIIKKHFGVEL
jgi:hypothetical protein